MSFIGITLAICMLMFLGYLADLIRAHSTLPVNLSIHTLITGLTFLLLTGAMAYTKRQHQDRPESQPQADNPSREFWPGLLMGTVALLDSIRLADEPVFAVACQQSALPVLTVLAAMLLLHTMRTTIRFRLTSILVAAATILLLTIELVTTWFIGLATQTALLMACGVLLVRQTRRPQTNLFGLTIVISLAPLTTAHFVQILDLHWGSQSTLDTATHLRWFGYLVALAGLCLDYFHTHFSRILADERALLRRVIDAIPHQITVSDVSGRFTLVNQAAAEFHGREVHELEGRLLQQIHTDQDQCEEFLATDQFVMEVGGSHTTDEVAVQDGQGNECWLNTIRTLLPALGTEESQILNFSRDITKRKEADKGLHRVEEILAYRWEMERVNSSISAIFMNRPLGDVNTGINEAVEILGKFVQADRCYVFQVDAKHDIVVNSHEWCAEDIPPLDLQERTLPNMSQPWVVAKLQNNEIINVPRVDDLPAEAAAERKRWRRQKLRSLLIVPINYEGKRLGSVGFECMRLQRDWLPEEIALLRSVAEPTCS
jgi:PAS domain S-box-containing protein